MAYGSFMASYMYIVSDSEVDLYMLKVSSYGSPA